jgi:hypothetical protein
MDGHDDLVSVMVPRRMLMRVYGLLSGDAVAVDNGVTKSARLTTADESSRSEDATSDYTEKLLRRMVAESDVAMRGILGLLASRPGEWLGAEDFVKTIKGNKDADGSTIAGTLGAFGHRLKSRYKSDQKPFEARYIAGQRGKRYRMPATMAKRIKHLLSETHEA